MLQCLREIQLLRTPLRVFEAGMSINGAVATCGWGAARESNSHNTRASSLSRRMCLTELVLGCG